ncbi:MAG: TlpA disulfide reductase family protein [Planctomycetota bacterium]|jgi:peroxiredoxin
MRILCKTIFVLCLVGLVVGCKGDGGKQTPGTAAGDFRLDTLAHDRFYLNQQKGRVVVLVFWATWCRFCKSELIELKSLGDMWGSRDIVIAALCADPENIDHVKKTVESLGIDYPVLLDRGAKVSRQYKITAFPTTIVIDRAGSISLVREGYNAAIMQQIKNNVAGLLASEGRAE